MRFDFNIITWIEYFIGAFICCLVDVFLGKIFLKRKPKYNLFITILIVCVFALLTIVNSLIFDNLIKIFFTILIMSSNYYIIFNEKNTSSFIYGVVTCIMFIISETIMALVIFVSNKYLNLDLQFLFSKSIIANIFIGINVCLISYFLRDKITFYINKISKNKIFIMLFYALTTIFVSLASINYLYINNWKFNYEFVLVILIVVGSLLLMMTLLRQYVKNKEIVDKYELLEEYMKTSADLIEKYSSTVHKYKNNLIAIKGYYKNSSNEGNDYIDSLLESYKTKKYNWFTKINYIPFDSIRYLSYYKLSKAEELNLKIFVDVDQEIKKIKSNLLDVSHSSVILEIIGEYFDNALYASNESEQKELNFNVYINNEIITFEIANTFLNNVDLNCIYKNGYTTKGKGHGFGLYDVDKSIKKYDFIDGNVEINDNYFISRLQLNLNFFNKKNKTEK